MSANTRKRDAPEGGNEPEALARNSQAKENLQTHLSLVQCRPNSSYIATQAQGKGVPRGLRRQEAGRPSGRTGGGFSEALVWGLGPGPRGGEPCSSSEPTRLGRPCSAEGQEELRSDACGGRATALPPAKPPRAPARKCASAAARGQRPRDGWGPAESLRTLPDRGECPRAAAARPRRATAQRPLRRK